MNGAPDPREVDQMKDLIRLMNEGVTFDEPTTETRAPIIEGVMDLSPSGVDPSVAAMKSILEAFHSTSNNPVQHMAERSEMDRELREALVTVQTDRGTRIGSWEIIINENERGLKSFDVTNTQTGEPIATDLSLYDAAHGICRALNEGHVINSTRIREILSAEFEYMRARQNAAEFREKASIYERRGDERQPLMEDRFDDALARAKAARSRIMKLAKL